MDPGTIALIMGALAAGSKFLEKKPSSKQYPTLSPEQGQFQNKLLEMLSGPGGIGQGGALQGGQNFLQQLLSGSPEATKAFEAPYKRQFNEETIPELANRFSGGFGIPGAASARSSSGFQQALAQAGTGLSENLAALRGGMQLQGIPLALQYLTHLIPGALHNRFGTGFKPGTPGPGGEFIGPVVGGFGQAFGQQTGANLANKWGP